MRIGSVSGIARSGDSSLFCPVPDAETLPILNMQSAERIFSAHKVGGVALDTWFRQSRAQSMVSDRAIKL